MNFAEAAFALASLLVAATFAHSLTRLSFAIAAVACAMKARVELDGRIHDDTHFSWSEKPTDNEN